MEYKYQEVRSFGCCYTGVSRDGESNVLHQERGACGFPSPYPATPINQSEESVVTGSTLGRYGVVRTYVGNIDKMNRAVSCPQHKKWRRTLHHDRRRANVQRYDLGKLSIIDCRVDSRHLGCVSSNVLERIGVQSPHIRTESARAMSWCWFRSRSVARPHTCLLPS